MKSVIVMGTSTGGLEALTTVLSGLPADLPAAVLAVMHIGDHPSVLPALLAPHCALPVAHARDRQPLRAGQVLLAPPGQHLLVVREGQALLAVLSRGARENSTRPAIDPLFRSAAQAAGPGVIGVVMTGYLDDGVNGLQAIKECGGTTVVQDPASALVPDMPRNALNQVAIDLCLPLPEIAPALARRALLGAQPLAAPERPPGWLTVENQFALGGGDMHQLRRIGQPTPYTCPSCGGALFSVSQARPTRFRCHTGHSYTLLSLLKEQNVHIETGVQAVMRALQEKERVAEQLAAESARGLTPDPGYADIARRARDDAEQLRGFLARQTADQQVPQPQPADN